LLSLFAPADGAAGPGLMVFLLQMVAIMAIFYFLIIRPKVQQERKHKDRLAQLKRGDEIVTTGGIVGEVVHLKDDRVTVKSGDARLIVQRDRIAEVRSPKTSEAGGGQAP
jgi:preprotein translocase subunit YajC